MIYLISGLCGLIFGSFANVCILRMPTDDSIWFPRSHCPRCSQPIKALHNIPVISFLWLRGRCAKCGTLISWQYPFVEMTMGLLFLFNAWFFSGALVFIILADVLSFYLLTLSIIDFRHRIIPDELSLSLLVIGILTAPLNPFFSGPLWTKVALSVLSGFGGGFLMWAMAWGGEKIFKKEALGGGDIKLIAATGSLLGWTGIAGSLLFGSMAGGLVAIVLLIMKKKKLGETLPFGPFLSIGIYLTCLYPHWLRIILNI